jgi:hypothetical protein
MIDAEERTVCTADEDGWRMSYVVTPDPPHNPLRSDYAWVDEHEQPISPVFAAYHEALLWRDGFRAAGPKDTENVCDCGRTKVVVLAPATYPFSDDSPSLQCNACGTYVKDYPEENK